MKITILLILVLLIPAGIMAQTSVTAQASAAPAPEAAANTPASGTLKQNASDTEAPQSRQKGSFCDAGYRGGVMSFNNFAPMTLDDLLTQIHNRFGVGFLIAPEVGKKPINIKADNVPWNLLLDSQLYVLGIRPIKYSCVGENMIELVENTTVATLEEARPDSVRLETEYLKLKYLQPSSSGTKNLAGNSSRSNSNQGNCSGGGGQSQGGYQAGGGQGAGSQGCGTFEKLINEIEKILGPEEQDKSNSRRDYVPERGYVGSDGAMSTAGSLIPSALPTYAISKRGSVSVIPGRNIIVVQAKSEQLKIIKKMIELADRPPFQVVIKGLVYTANENRLRDIGIQTSITADTADGRSSSSVLGHTLGSAGTLFDFSTILGTSFFRAQATALEQNGVISIKSRPFAVVLDGDTTDLEVGRQIPVLTQGGVLGGVPGNLEFIGASNLLSVTPRVIDDDNGKPIAVNLELQIESNEVDTAVVSQGIPAVNRRSIQSRLIMNQDKTVILGGFTVDSLSNDVSKTPGLGDIPILGYLFKRKVKRGEINRLYFAVSVEVVPYGQVIEPVVVPGATTDVPTVLPEMIKPLGKKATEPVISNPAKPNN